MATLWAVIMAGGSGTRFWPASRRDRPKQLLELFGPQTLLAAAVARLQPLVPAERILIATGAHLVDPVRAACPGIGAANILGEPVPRDSAGAVTLAAARVYARDPDATLAICTADHLIEPVDAFQRAVAALQAAAEREQALGTFGIAPDAPETGYGYIRQGAPLATVDGVTCRRVEAFVEKPDRATAEGYLAAGDYVWNSGLFVFPLPILRAGLAAHLPAHAAALEALAGGFAGGGEAMVVDQVFRGLPAISIDFGLMEKAERVIVATAPFSWDDVGAWPAVARVHPADAAGNVLLGDAALVDCRGVIAVSDGPLVAALGCEDLLLVAYGGAILACPRERAGDLKQLIAQLRATGRADVL